MIPPEVVPGLDGVPTVLCFDRESYDYMTAEQKVIASMSHGPVRIVLVTVVDGGIAWKLAAP